jgi:outer membrane protein TolC
MAHAANPEVGAARTAIQAARAGLQRSRAWLPSNPYLSGGAGRTTQAGVGSNYGMFLSQEIEIAGQRSHRIRAATEGVEKATFDARNAEQLLSAAVKTAFVEGQVSADRVTIAQQTVEVAAMLTRQLQQGTSGGDGQRLNLNNARIQENRARRELAALERARASALDTLRRLIGVALDQEIELLGAPLAAVRPLPTPAELVARALRQRPDLLAQRHSVEQAHLQLALLSREAVPNITISGNVSRFEGATLTGGDIGVPLPIFQGKGPEIQEAIAERDRVQLELQNLERTIEQEAREALRACEAAAADLQSLREEIMPRSEDNLQIQRRLYERDEATLADVASTQIELLSARRDYVDAVQAYNEALIELQRIVGGSLNP